MKINTPKIGEILKVEINLSLLKLIYLGQFVSDLRKLGPAILLRVFSVQIKRKIGNLAQALCSVVNQTFLVLLGHTVHLLGCISETGSDRNFLDVNGQYFLL